MTAVAIAPIDEERARYAERLRGLAAGFALRARDPRPGDDVAALGVAAAEARRLAAEVAAGVIAIPDDRGPSRVPEAWQREALLLARATPPRTDRGIRAGGR